MPIRVYDIARKLGIESKEVLAKAREVGIAEARVPSSMLDTSTAASLEAALQPLMAESHRSGLRSISLGNFKAFAEPQTVPIRPLTLVFGANSSGKSSLLHGLLLARHALETGDLNALQTHVGGDSVDFGGFGCYVHRRDLENRVELGFELQPVDTTKGPPWLAPFASKLSVVILIGCEVNDPLGQPLRYGKPRVLQTRISVSGEELAVVKHRLPAGLVERVLSETHEMALPEVVATRASRAMSSEFRIDRLNTNHPATRSLLEASLRPAPTLPEITPQDTDAAFAVLGSVVPSLAVVRGKLLPSDVGYAEGPEPAPTRVSPGDRTEELRRALRLGLPQELGALLQAVEAWLTDALRRLCYLGALRSFPPRHLTLQGRDDRNWVPGGGFAWEAVCKDPMLREAANAWLTSADRLQTPYKLSVRRFISPPNLEPTIAEALGDEFDSNPASFREGQFDSDALAATIVRRLEANEELERIDELVLVDQRTNTVVSHRDVGIGISQVLPVLVHAYGDRGKIVAIEQPEIHLHPALQAELGDVFIESALGERQNTFLLETHSEHLILRILRRVRETTENRLPEGATPVRPEDVAVLFVEPTSTGSVVRHLPVTRDGDFDQPWPGGFFAERFQDLP